MTDATALARSAARQAGRGIDDFEPSGARLRLRDVTGGEPAAVPPEATARPVGGGAVLRAMARQSGMTAEQLRATAPVAQGAPAAPPPSPAQGTDLDPQSGFPPSRREPLTPMRRVIAARLATSKREAPHYYMSAECLADPLLAMRRDLNAALPPEERLSVNDLVLKLTACCLARDPRLNAAWAGDAIARFEQVNLAVAVAVGGGLVTPVLRDAGAMGLRRLHAEMRALADAARRRALPKEAYQGGSFTVSNLGMYPVSHFAAIVNPPQAAILAVAAAERRAVALDDERTAVRRVMTVTLSVDHRVADGVAGAEFLADFKALVEEPRRALL